MVSATSQEVFVSYSHDTTHHMERVRELADKLRMEGVDCDLDQYEETPAEGWPRWMHRKIQDAKFVLVVCTEAYFQRNEGKRTKQDKDMGKGMGVICEGGIIINELYEQGGDNLKFIPVIFDYSDKIFIPAPLRPTTYYNIGKKAGYDDLYRRLTGQPKIKKPELGKIKIPEPEKLEALPEKVVKSSPAVLLLSPIDVELWDAAKWSGTFFLWGDGTIIPTLGIGYQNEEAAKKIFEGWRERFGKVDINEELRIAIVDGPISGQGDGYTVHISLNPAAFNEEMKARVKENLAFTFMVSRINRMDTSDGSAYLEKFKAEFAKYKKYELAPGIVSRTEKTIKPIHNLSIQKSSIVFRHSSEIGKHDIDAIVLETGSK